jgi:hypothetical protein
VVLNPAGEKLGLGDDGAASNQDGSYSSDDGFVVRTDKGETGGSQEEGGEDFLMNINDIKDDHYSDEEVIEEDEEIFGAVVNE